MSREIYFAHDGQDGPSPRQNFLEAAGYEVSAFADPDEMMSALAERKPDLVLLDVLLPKRNGFDVCREVRVRFERTDLPILLATALYTTRVYREEARAAGANDLLVKPMKLDELLRRLEDALDEQDPQAKVA
jgi:DNA-binding response OmpR family regulator